MTKRARLSEGPSAREKRHRSEPRDDSARTVTLRSRQSREREPPRQSGGREPSRRSRDRERRPAEKLRSRERPRADASRLGGRSESGDASSKTGAADSKGSTAAMDLALSTRVPTTRSADEDLAAALSAAAKTANEALLALPAPSPGEDRSGEKPKPQQSEVAGNSSSKAIATSSSKACGGSSVISPNLLALMHAEPGAEIPSLASLLRDPNAPPDPMAPPPATSTEVSCTDLVPVGTSTSSATLSSELSQALAIYKPSTLSQLPAGPLPVGLLAGTGVSSTGAAAAAAATPLLTRSKKAKKRARAESAWNQTYELQCIRKDFEFALGGCGEGLKEETGLQRGLLLFKEVFRLGVAEALCDFTVACAGGQGNLPALKAVLEILKENIGPNNTKGVDAIDFQIYQQVIDNVSLSPNADFVVEALKVLLGARFAPRLAEFPSDDALEYFVRQNYYLSLEFTEDMRQCIASVEAAKRGSSTCEVSHAPPMRIAGYGNQAGPSADAEALYSVQPVQGHCWSMQKNRWREEFFGHTDAPARGDVLLLRRGNDILVAVAQSTTSGPRDGVRVAVQQVEHLRRMLRERGRGAVLVDASVGPSKVSLDRMRAAIVDVCRRTTQVPAMQWWLIHRPPTNANSSTVRDKDPSLDLKLRLFIIEEPSAGGPQRHELSVANAVVGQPPRGLRMFGQLLFVSENPWLKKPCNPKVSTNRVVLCWQGGDQVDPVTRGYNAVAGGAVAVIIIGDDDAEESVEPGEAIVAAGEATPIPVLRLSKRDGLTLMCKAMQMEPAHIEVLFSRVGAGATNLGVPLDRSQHRAIAAVFDPPPKPKQGRVTLIQGPPGTGKTTVALHVISRWLEKDETSKVLVTGFSNVAIDNIALGLQKRNLGPILRVGRGQTELSRDRLQDYLKANPAFPALESMRQTLHSDVPGTKSDMLKLERKMTREAIASSRVVCATCITCGGDLLVGTAFKKVLFDEAAQATEPASLTPLTMSTEELVLIGDHKQLPPPVHCLDAGKLGLCESLFERLGKMGVPRHMLTVQYRMHPCLAAFSSWAFYDSVVTDGIGPGDRPAPIGYPWPDPTRPLCFEGVGDANGGLEQKSGTSLCNPTEAARVSAIAKTIVMAGDVAAEDVTVITPYSAQAVMLKSQLRGTGISVSTIDSYQGRETEVIVCSVVRCAASRGVGFLTDVRRFNVLLTRARRGLIVVGHQATMQCERTWRAWVWHVVREQLFRGQVNTSIAMEAEPTRADLQDDEGEPGMFGNTEVPPSGPGLWMAFAGDVWPRLDPDAIVPWKPSASAKAWARAKGINLNVQPNAMRMPVGLVQR